MDVLRLTTVGLLVLLALGCVNTVLGQAVTKNLEAAIIKPVMRSAMWAYLGNAVYADQLRTAVNYDYFSRLHCGGKLVSDGLYGCTQEIGCKYLEHICALYLERLEENMAKHFKEYSHEMFLIFM